MSDFGRLWSYGNFLIPVHAIVLTALRIHLASDVLNFVSYLLSCRHYFTTCLAHPAANNPDSVSQHFDDI